MGSVKDLVVVRNPSACVMGEGVFEFSNRYSVFDWGEMPDHIPYKGESLCRTTAYFFRELERAGVPTHHIDDKNPTMPQNEMRIKMVRVVPPKKIADGNGKVIYDYSDYRDLRGNFLIPLEIIYRNGLPEGSSVFKRLRLEEGKSGRLTLQDLGLDHEPKPGEVFAKPYFDVSTKLEDGDRYLGWKGAQSISRLSDQELKDIQEGVLTANSFITSAATNAGLVNWDGKFEFAFTPERRLMLVDTVGTLDECRFTYGGTHVSKEILRQYYMRTQPDWVAQIDEAKKSGAEEWKSTVSARPNPLPESLREIISYMYRAAANEMTGANTFPAPPLGEVVAEYKKYMESLKE